MKYIAHRGLFNGPDKTLENHPEQILRALSLGFDVEIDVWYVDGEWWLGHDAPTYPIDVNFLDHSQMWIHCKNIDALYELGRMVYMNNDYFWHQEDDCTLTANGYIWTYPGKPLTTKSIMVMPESVDQLDSVNTTSCYGVCSDYVAKLIV
jgi:hypothetical protein